MARKSSLVFLILMAVVIAFFLGYRLKNWISENKPAAENGTENPAAAEKGFQGPSSSPVGAVTGPKNNPPGTIR